MVALSVVQMADMMDAHSADMKVEHLVLMLEQTMAASSVPLKVAL